MSLVDTPLTMKSKELEAYCLLDSSWKGNSDRYAMGRYGVQVSQMKDASGNFVMTPISSLPDFEGVIQGGRQFIFDCKVCGSASFSLDNDKFKKRQLTHMMNRSRFGVVCFLLIHFSERRLKTKTDEAATWAFPIHPEEPFWRQFDRGEVRSISRINCEEYGVIVDWWLPPGCRKIRPNLYPVIEHLCD